MKNILATISSIGALALLSTTPLAAQFTKSNSFPINLSDHVNPGATVSGFYQPAQTFITQLNQMVSTGSLVSTINGQTVSQAVGLAILNLMQGNSGGLATVQDALNTAGAPTVETANLMKAMSRVMAGNKTLSRAEITNVVLAYNTMINASSVGFLSTASPMLIGINAALFNILSAAGINSGS